MSARGPEFDDLLRGVFERLREGAGAVALVGASHKPERPSHMIMKYLLDRGVDVAPVNPGLAGGELLGRRVFATLADIDRPVFLVDVFRASDAALDVAREAAQLAADKGIEVVWLQKGVINDEALREAEEAGLVAVQDLCIMVEMERIAP